MASSGSSPGVSTCVRRTARTPRSLTAAGEVGFFSPGSYWPFGLALAAALAALGMVFWQYWLIGAGLVAVVFSACGLLFEYYSGTRRTAEH